MPDCLPTASFGATILQRGPHEEDPLRRAEGG